MSRNQNIVKPHRKLGFLPRWRKMTWVFNIFNLIMLIWVITGAATANGQPSDCNGLSAKTCNEASDAGTAIGVTLIVVLWIIGFFILSVIWLMTKPSRHCPVCGGGVKKGHMVCKSCGHDFRAQTQEFGPANA